jgi:hypothetical protein
MTPKRAFEDGDYRTARALAEQTIANADASEKAKASARAVLEKTSPPPLAKYIFLLAAVLLVILSVFWIGESKRHTGDTTAPATSAP